MRRFVPLLLSTLVPFASEAATVAVLPFAPGDESDPHTGLGIAIAGMITADLVQAPGIEVVERDRIDAVLGELDLAATPYVDPKTAVKLGKVASAEFIVTGHVVVSDKQLFLDASLIDVQSGKIVKAAAAQGKVDDFVSVEKDLVTQFYGGLKVTLDAASQRRMMMETPTESWEAFDIYGAGLGMAAIGDPVSARKAYEAALLVDPDFAEARDALVGLQTTIERERERQSTVADEKHAAAEKAVMARFPADQAAMPATTSAPEKNMEATVGFALRQMVLEDRGDDCTRMGEMRSYLARTQFQIAEPPRVIAGPTAGTFVYRVREVAEELGYDELPSTVKGARESAYDSPAQRAKLLESIDRFVVADGLDLMWGEDAGSGLLGSIRRCVGTPGSPAALDEFAEQLRKAGVSDTVTECCDMTLGEAVEVYTLNVMAMDEGPSDDMQKRSKRLIERRPEGDPVRAAISQRLEPVQKHAERWTESRIRRYGLSPDELVRVMDGIANSDPKVVNVESSVCAYFEQMEGPRAKEWSLQYTSYVEQHEDRSLSWHIDNAGRVFAMYRDYGCLAGVPGRFTGVADLMSFLNEQKRQPRPASAPEIDCQRGWSTIQQITQPVTMQSIATNPAVYEPPFAYSLDLVYHTGIVFYGCVESP